MEDFVALKDDSLEAASGGRMVDRDTGNYIWYEVVNRDTLSKIGNRFNCKWQVIYQVNKKTIGPNPDLIRPGQVLKIPQW